MAAGVSDPLPAMLASDPTPGNLARAWEVAWRRAQRGTAWTPPVCSDLRLAVTGVLLAW